MVRHNPDEEGAVVMKAPSDSHQKKNNPKYVAILFRLLALHLVELGIWKLFLWYWTPS